VDELRTGAGQTARDAHTLLEMLTPVVKSWPSQYCLEANSLAIQVHGGYGYTRDFPVEQYWRDNRLNMIHEGAHGIHGLDLLGRKVRMDDGAGLRLFAERVTETVTRAQATAGFEAPAQELATALSALVQATHEAWSSPDPEAVLANATAYLEAFGHVTIAWLWLDLALCASRSGQATDEATQAHRQGLIHTMRYFFDYELPRIEAWLRVVARRTATCRDMPDAWF
jgi:butyryl-CoA dehydrogenase